MTAPSNANTSGLEVVAWRFRARPDRNWHRTNCPKVIEQERLDGSEVEPDLVTAASAQAAIDALKARVAELEAAKWEAKHVDTMNDMVAMGLARDAEKARTDRLAKALEAVISYAPDIRPARIARAALQQEG